MADLQTKKKIVILGGGIAGLTTAFELTNDPAWKDKYEITVHQMGWRLGGKCAAGRGPNGRIEEHGIHLFGGGYYNALGLMSQCYDELCSHAQGWPLTFEQAFKREYFNIVWDDSTTPRTRFDIKLPPNGLEPTDGAQLQSVIHMLGMAVQNVQEMLTRNDSNDVTMRKMFNQASGMVAGKGGFFGGLLDIVGTGTQWVGGLFGVKPKSAAFDKGMALMDMLAAHAKGAAAGASLQEMANEAKSWRAGWSLGDALLDKLPGKLRLGYLLTDYLSAVAHGVIHDMLLGGKSFADMDSEPWDIWLSKHGADKATRESWFAMAPLRILYAFPNGGNSSIGNASLGAGAYLQWTLRTFGYLGAPFWFFAAGSGETLIAPLYEALKRRGVKFEFFHKVENLRLDASGTSIAAIEINQQAKPIGGTYDPFMPGEIKGLSCWPNAPVYGRLEAGAAIEARKGDLESYWCNESVGKLTLNAGTDFHQIVFAISLGAVPFVCKELVERSAQWRSMVDGIRTIETQSLQLWFNENSETLGVNIQSKHAGAVALTCGYAAPFDGVVDFTPLIELEDWPVDGKPKALWYFSDVMPSKPLTGEDLANPAYPDNRRTAVRANSVAFLNTQPNPALLPNAAKGGGFDYEKLVASPATRGPARLDEQFVRVNFEPSERYVTAPVDTTRLRLEAGKSGFDNLILAGDWIYTGLNVGCVEATVMSGKLASNAICQQPPISSIIGYT